MRIAITHRSLSIRQKLRLIVMVTVATALLLTCAAVLGYDYMAFREATRNHLDVLAEIFGSGSTAALSFGDPKATEEILAGLKAERHIVGACIYSSSGKLFATYRRGPEPEMFAPPPLRSDGSWFEGSRPIVFKRITLRRQIIVSTYLEPQWEEIQDRLQKVTAV